MDWLRGAELLNLWLSRKPAYSALLAKRTQPIWYSVC